MFGKKMFAAAMLGLATLFGSAGSAEATDYGTGYGSTCYQPSSYQQTASYRWVTTYETRYSTEYVSVPTTDYCGRTVYVNKPYSVAVRAPVRKLVRVY